jgi:hypothetical protein
VRTELGEDVAGEREGWLALGGGRGHLCGRCACIYSVEVIGAFFLCMVEVIVKVTVRACVWLLTRQIFERVVELFGGARFGCYRRRIMRREGRKAAFSGTRDEAATNDGVCSSIYVSSRPLFWLETVYLKS